MKSEESNQVRCSDCGDSCEYPLAYGPEAPVNYYAVPENERDERCELDRDICCVDDQFYVVGNLEIPVSDISDIFSWDIWVSVSLENMKRMMDLWESEYRANEAPYFGWLCSSLPGYPETIGLKTSIHTREVGRRPFIELEPTDHPLAIEQRSGITMDRVAELAGIINSQK